MSEVTEAPPQAAANAEARPLQGSHIWYELMTTDPDGAKAFYDRSSGLVRSANACPATRTIG